jgi:hypothetical protein
MKYKAIQQPLLSNDAVKNGRCSVMASTDTYARIEELLEAIFSVQSVPRLYNEGQMPLEKSLEMAVRRVGGWVRLPPAWELDSWSNELVVGQFSALKKRSTEAEGHHAMTGEDIADLEDLVSAVVNCRVWVN